MLVQALQETDDVLGANGPGHQAEKEAGAAAVGRVGQRSDGREVLPVAEAVAQDRGLPPRRPGALD